MVSCVCALALLASAARRRSFPTSTVRLLVPFAAAGRPMWWRASSPTSVGALGRQAGAGREPPGAGTILMTTRSPRPPRRSHARRRHQLAADQSGDRHEAALRHVQGDRGVSMIATQPVALVANKDFPGNTLAEVVDAGEEGGRAD
jgi:hypothetical protein